MSDLLMALLLGGLALMGFGTLAFMHVFMVPKEHLPRRRKKPAQAPALRPNGVAEDTSRVGSEDA